MLGNLGVSNVGALALLSVEETFVDKLGDRLACGHAADAMTLAKFSLRWDRHPGGPFAAANSLSDEFLELVVARNGSTLDTLDHFPPVGALRMMCCPLVVLSIPVNNLGRVCLACQA